jgi:oxalate decarboxylase/phosphoglucose isomerase-like protein (cupin superfamily)
MLISLSTLLLQHLFMAYIQQPRRKFIQTGVIGFCIALFAAVPKISFASFKAGKGIVVRESEGVHILTGRRKVPITIKISKTRDGIDNISFCVEDMSPGRKMRVHKHLNNDELIFIHKGEGAFTLDEEVMDVKAGDVIFVPRDTWHGLDNTGRENLQMMFQYSPAGFEEYFIENGTLVGMPPKERTKEEYAATEKRYGMVYKTNE